MTNTLVNKAWEFIENIGQREGSVVIAGGTIADVWFNKEFKDLDVFVSKTELDHVETFANYYGFEQVQLPSQFKDEEDSYGEMHSVLIGQDESDVVSVFKGKFLDYDMDIVVVKDEDVVNHITTKFDQSIKACWFDGEYHYSDAFMKTIETGLITPIRMESSNYARAWLSANKYDLKLSNLYNLSRDYVAYAHKNDLLDDLLSDATISKMEGLEDKMFDFTVNRGNVVLMDVFMKHGRSSKKLYRKLCNIADQEMVTEHPLSQAEVSVAFETSEHSKFMTCVSAVRYAVVGDSYEDLEGERQAAYNAIHALSYLAPHLFMDGKCIDENEREVRLGKYLMKIQRKHEIFSREDILPNMTEMKRLLDNRSSSNKAQVFITGSKHSLTHISTNTKWTSCQRWGGFQTPLGTNYGLLANVSGSTLVAYVADERADDKSSKWHARVLIRIGHDSTLLIERPYTNRAEYAGKSFVQGLKASLEKLGYVVATTPEEAMDFDGLPMWSKPYLDCADMYNLEKEDGVFVFKGRRVEIELQQRQKAIQDALDAVVKSATLSYTKTGKYQRTAVVEIPEELLEEVKWALDNSHGILHFNRINNAADVRHDSGRAQVTHESLELGVIVVIKEVLWSLQEENNRYNRESFRPMFRHVDAVQAFPAFQIGQAVAAPRAIAIQAMVVRPVAEDADDEFLPF